MYLVFSLVILLSAKLFCSSSLNDVVLLYRLVIRCLFSLDCHINFKSNQWFWCCQSYTDSDDACVFWTFEYSHCYDVCSI